MRCRMMGGMMRLKETDVDKPSTREFVRMWMEGFLHRQYYYQAQGPVSS